MTATAPRATSAPPLGRRAAWRRRVARLERPLLAGGLTLVAFHLLDLALSGPDTTILGVLGIVGVPVAWLVLRPRLSRPTRAALGVSVGLLAFGFGVVSHGLHVVNSAPDWPDVTGVGMIAGGLLSVAAVDHPCPALGDPGVLARDRPPGGPHQDGGRPGASAWYVPSTNRTAVVLSHGSAGSRERVAAHVRMLARHGYGVLALDNPGNGESQGRSNGLGNNAQPALDAALAWLVRRPDVDSRRIAGVGTSLGGEVLLEAAARDPRIRAVVSDGAARPEDVDDAKPPPLADRIMTWIYMQVVPGVSGTRLAPSLNGLVRPSRPVRHC